MDTLQIEYQTFKSQLAEAQRSFNTPLQAKDDQMETHIPIQINFLQGELDNQSDQLDQAEKNAEVERLKNASRNKSSQSGDAEEIQDLNEIIIETKANAVNLQEELNNVRNTNDSLKWRLLRLAGEEGDDYDGDNDEEEEEGEGEEEEK
ncbi:hypothetical protein CC78DRAFT_581017 [Lojkania enalia]|uniref:Uncharacterized protein n=1 Tax=Lojkania enalia TaxID=147567 RepID=A0A9P4KA50_9PLEO|nr:hypothetical protein CC78DRAFT_581017 [Didymosphaeria enalia]